MAEAQGPKVLSKTVPAYSRATYDMGSDIGQNDASVEVASPTPGAP